MDQESNEAAVSEVKVINAEEFNEEKTLFEWTAPERSYQKRDRDFWVTAVSILVLVSIIFIFVKEFFLIIALVSVLFLYYVLATVPPGMIRSKITNRAVYFGEARYEWQTLERFWFKTSLSSQLLMIGTRLAFPRQITMVINLPDKEKIKEIIIKRIPLLESPPNFTDKLTKWFAEKLPLEMRDKNTDSQKTA